MGEFVCMGEQVNGLCRSVVEAHDHLLEVTYITAERSDTFLTPASNPTERDRMLFPSARKMDL